MRLLSWNVRDLLGDPLAVHRVVASAGPDVVCLQEAPRRPGAALRLRQLERGFGLHCVAGGRRSGGTAIFVAPGVRVDWAWAFRLPVAGIFTRTRGAAVADVLVPEAGEFTVASVHLPLRAAERLDHVRRIRRVVAWRGRDAVVAGDLNEPPGGPAWRVWSPVVADLAPPGVGPTFPVIDPRVRIDAVLTGPGLGIRFPADVPWDVADVRRASDHRPVLVEITR